MATSKDKERYRVARYWINAVGGIEKAAAITGVSTRTLERIFAGKKPPPPRLLEEMAEYDDSLMPNTRLSAELRAAAEPAGGQADA